MPFLKHYYSILDVEVCLESDSRDFLNIFDQDYNWFKISSSSGVNQHGFLVILNGREEDSSVRQGEEVFSLVGHPDKINGAYQFVLKRIFSQIREFFLIHAGVVAKDGKALVLAGSPGTGKSTMIMKLLTSGFTFLSDDFCAIHQKTGHIYPFPRSLWLAQDQMPQSTAPFGKVGREKIPVSSGALPGPVVENAACKLGCLICLDADKMTNTYFQLNLHLKPENSLLIDNLRKLDDLEVVLPDNEGGEYVIRYSKGKRLSNQIQQILADHKDLIWNVYRWNNAPIDFTKEAVLSSISAHEAAFRVIRELKNRIFENESTLSSESIADVFITLCELLAGCPCYRLTVGSFETMLALIFKAQGH